MKDYLLAIGKFLLWTFGIVAVMWLVAYCGLNMLIYLWAEFIR